MIKFEYHTQDLELETPNNSVILEWEGEEEDIIDVVNKFKYFLLAKSYPNSLVNRLQYLTDSQLAKLKLLNEELDED